MKILPYDEVDPDGVKVIDWTSFRWFLSPELARELREKDPWLPDHYALYAVDDDEVRAQVGYCVVDTDTTEGLEKVGFVWGVCTRPDSARRGYSTALFEETHRILLEEDVRFAVLGTRRSWVAYDLYRKFGYRDFGHFSSAIKPCSGPAETDVVCKKGLTDQDAHGIYKRYAEDLLGFTHRFEGVISIREMNFHDGPYDRHSYFRDGEMIGFTIGKSTDRYINLIDMCAVDIDDVPDMIAALEKDTGTGHIMYDWTPRRAIIERLVRSGASEIGTTWGTFMAVDLTGELDIGGIEDLYGVGDDLFTMSDLDAY